MIWLWWQVKQVACFFRATIEIIQKQQELLQNLKHMNEHEEKI